VILLIAAGAAEATPLQLVEAWHLERGGDGVAAARLYLSWARDHAEEPSALAGYAGFLRTERNLDTIVDAGRVLAISLPRLPGAWPLVAETSRLFELAGLDEEAAALADDAWKRGGPAGLLLRAQRLRLVMGDLEAYAAAAARVVALPGLDPLAPAFDLLSGLLETGVSGAERVLAGSTDPATRVLAAWNLFEAARAGGDKAAAARAATRIAELFPGSPESSLALATATGAPSRLIEAPSPALFTTLAAPILETPTTVITPPTAPVASWVVQAGSFRVRENADELVMDLRRAGFEPIIRESIVQGTTLWRVIAGIGLDRKTADDLVERLRASGYAGIVVGG
jgi:hypothetical protein